MDSYKVFKRAICKDDERPPVPKQVPPSLAAMMTQCWHKEPAVRPSFAEVLRQLDLVLLDIAIKDDAANKFWKAHFAGKFRVPWAEFVTAFLRFLECPLPPDSTRVKCLHALLAEKVVESGVGMREEVVSPDMLGKLLAWFGPSGPTMLERLESLLRQPWFHGMIEKTEAEGKLSGQPKGSYLVRLSSTSPGCFTISKVGKNDGISHQRIDYHAGKGFSCLIQGPDGTTREAVGAVPLETYLAQHSKELYLITPIECSTWKHLFVTSSIEGYLNVSADD